MVCIYGYLTGTDFQAVEIILFKAVNFHFPVQVSVSGEDPFAVFVTLEEPADLVSTGRGH